MTASTATSSQSNSMSSKRRPAVRVERKIEMPERKTTAVSGSCRAAAAVSESSRTQTKTEVGAVRTRTSRPHHCRSTCAGRGCTSALIEASLRELDLDERRARRPHVDLLRLEPLEDAPALLLVLDQARPHRNVQLNIPLQVKREVGVRTQVRVPVASTRRAGQVDGLAVQ